MNKDAEKEIDRLLDDNMDEIGGAYHYRNVEWTTRILREAMQWAYADAANVYKKEHLLEPTFDIDDVAYDNAVDHCVGTIEQRAKEE